MGEGAPAREAHENRFLKLELKTCPLSNYLAAAARSVKSFDKTTDLAQTKVAKVLYIYIFSLPVIKITLVI